MFDPLTLLWSLIAAVGVGIMLNRLHETRITLRVARDGGNQNKIDIAKNHLKAAIGRLYVVSFNLIIGLSILLIPGPAGSPSRRFILFILAFGLITGEIVLILLSFNDSQLEKRIMKRNLSEWSDK